jgi:hypothetical protein
VKDGIRLLLNRQLSLGGWNYGNTTVFDQELRPFPESTGLALNALAGRVPRYAVQKSLAYLNSEVSRLRTPLSLGWAIHGLKAWHIPVPFAQEWGQECLSRESRYGGYDTGSLSVLLSALLAPAGLGSLWEMT